MPSDIQRSHGQVFGTEKFGHTWGRDSQVSEMSSHSGVAMGSPRCVLPCSQTLGDQERSEDLWLVSGRNLQLVLGMADGKQGRMAHSWCSGDLAVPEGSEKPGCVWGSSLRTPVHA